MCKEMAIELQKMNLSIEAIATVAKVSTDLVKQWLNE